MIISVGYRVNSKNATAFRVWATGVLKKYLTDGYAINEKRIGAEKIQMLAQTINLLKRASENQIENLDPMMRELLNVAGQFADGLEVLDNYDHEKLDERGLHKTKAAEITVDELLREIAKMKPKFGALFGAPKDDSFASSIGQIYQSFDDKDLYPTLEEKAATLLYLVVKNHSFVDGNKRIAAFCFAYFLAKNKILFNKKGAKIIDDAALAALTLLVAESKPTEMDTIRRVIVSILNLGENK
jgi:prophage maintenance system killer protein